MANSYDIDKLTPSGWERVKRTNSDGYPVGIYNAREAEHLAMMLSKAGGTFRAKGYQFEQVYTNGRVSIGPLPGVQPPDSYTGH